MSWHVYRVYDEAGDVIYVGQTSDLKRRTWQHLHSTPGAARVESFDEYDTKGGAMSVESVLIRAHQPPLNVQDNPNRGEVETDAERTERLVRQLVEQHLLFGEVYRSMSRRAEAAA